MRLILETWRCFKNQKYPDGEINEQSYGNPQPRLLDYLNDKNLIKYRTIDPFRDNICKKIGFKAVRQQDEAFMAPVTGNQDTGVQIGIHHCGRR